MPSELEGKALRHMVNEKGHLWNALDQYFAEKSARLAVMCADQMKQVPRDTERASDYAARSDENALTMAQLESFARDL